MDFLHFLGRFHVVVLHVPLGIIVAVFVLEWLVRREKYRHLAAASPFLWGAAAVSAVGTAILGYMHFAEGGFVGPSAAQHRTFGTALAVLLTGVAALRLSPYASRYAPVFFPASILFLALASITGHYGGNLTHGSTFLVEYAPQPVRSLAGLPPRRPPVENLAMADPFLDLVKPMLDRRCRDCHNREQPEAELDMTTYDSLMEGGETGSVIVAGRPEFSELLNRITLPPDDDAFMPAEGNTPLTDRQVEIIEWWIAAGAPTDVTFSELDAELPEDVRELISAELDL